MKKIKLLPSVLMLVLCVGVLCMGIYAATPVTHNVSGTITVNAAGATVSITGYVNYSEPLFDKVTSRTDTTTTITKNDLLKFNTQGFSSVEEIPAKLIRLKVENQSSVPIGVYFFNPESTLPNDGLAEVENILLSYEIKDQNDNSESPATIAKVWLTSYAYCAAGGSVDMMAYIAPQVLPVFDDLSGKLNLTLNVEPYKVEYEESDGTFTAGKLHKLPTDFSSTYVTMSCANGIICSPGRITEYTATTLTAKGFWGFLAGAQLTLEGGVLDNLWQCTIQGDAVEVCVSNTIEVDSMNPCSNNQLFLNETITTISVPTMKYELSSNVHLFIPASVTSIEAGALIDYMCQPSFSRITVIAGDGTLEPYDLPDGSETTMSMDAHIRWYLTPDGSGEEVTQITDRNETVTYYAIDTNA